jgi:transposase
MGEVGCYSMKSNNRNTDATILAEVEKLLNSEKDRRLYERYLTIYHHLMGLTNREIASWIRRNVNTIGSYVNAFKKKGLEGLNLQHSPGRPTQLTKEQEQQLIDVISTQTPEEVGLLAQMNWNGTIVRKWIDQEFGISYSARGVLDLLHRLGFSHTRPTYTLTKADEKKQAEFKVTFNVLKKN